MTFLSPPSSVPEYLWLQLPSQWTIPLFSSVWAIKVPVCILSHSPCKACLPCFLFLQFLRESVLSSCPGLPHLQAVVTKWGWKLKLANCAIYAEHKESSVWMNFKYGVGRGHCWIANLFGKVFKLVLGLPLKFEIRGINGWFKLHPVSVRRSLEAWSGILKKDGVPWLLLTFNGICSLLWLGGVVMFYIDSAVKLVSEILSPICFLPLWCWCLPFPPHLL